MAGLNTETGRKQAKVFEDLESQGTVTPEKMFEQTGVYRGADGKLRYEIDDRNASLIKMPKAGESYSLYQILKFDDLYKEYFKDIVGQGKIYKPLRNIDVKFVKDKDMIATATYQPDSDSIVINLAKMASPAKKDLASGTLGVKARITSSLYMKYNMQFKDEKIFYLVLILTTMLEQSPNYKTLEAKDTIADSDRAKKAYLEDNFIAEAKRNLSLKEIDELKFLELLVYSEYLVNTNNRKALRESIFEYYYLIIVKQMLKELFLILQAT